MKRTMPIAILAAFLTLGFWVGHVFAQAQTYDNSLRVGAYFVQYHVNADDITGPFVPPGTNLDVKNTNTLYLAYVRRIDQDWDVEFAFGNPPKTETVGKGPATLGSAPYDGQVIATAKWFSPSLLVQYKFFDESSAVRPYIGAGVNFTHFYDIQSTAAGSAASGGPTTTKLSNSIGPALNVGVAWRISGPWHAYASYNYASVVSNLTATTAGIVRTTTIRFNPTAAVLAVGYSF